MQLKLSNFFQPASTLINDHARRGKEVIDLTGDGKTTQKKRRAHEPSNEPKKTMDEIRAQLAERRKRFEKNAAPTPGRKRAQSESGLRYKKRKLEKKASEEIQCTACTYLNAAGSSRCEMCGNKISTLQFKSLKKKKILKPVTAKVSNQSDSPQKIKTKIKSQFSQPAKPKRKLPRKKRSWTEVKSQKTEEVVDGVRIERDRKGKVVVKMCFKVRKNYYKSILNGDKTVEGRLSGKVKKKVKVGDIIKMFVPRTSDLYIYCQVVQMREFETFKEMLEGVGLKKCLPLCENVEEGVKLYHSFPKFKDLEKVLGVIAIYIKVLDLK